MSLDFDVAGPYAGDLKTAYAPESEPEKVKWQQAFAGPNGYLDLRKLFDKDKVSSYLQTHIYSTKEQKATLLLGSEASVACGSMAPWCMKLWGRPGCAG